MRLRNPKGAYVEFEYHGLGEVVRPRSQEDIEKMQAYMHSFHEAVDALILYDNKEFYIQREDHEDMRYQAFEGSVHTVLVREFRPDTWELGPIYEL